GAVAGWLAGRGWSLPRWVAWVLRGPVVGLGLVAALFWLGTHWGRTLWYPYTTASPFLFSLLALAGGALLLWVFGNSGSLWCAPLRWAPLKLAGTLSYGIYLFHQVGFALAYLWFYAPTPAFPWKDTAFFLISLAVTFGLAGLGHVLVERPCMALKERF